MSPDESSASSKAAERLAVIVDAAERAALKVIDDAEQEAQRYLEEAKARADRLVAERLREAADQLERDGAGGAEAPPLRSLSPKPPTPEEKAPPPEPPASPAGKEPDPEPARSPEPVTPPAPQGGGGSSAAARLLATQMAVSGASRKEIEMRLRNGFEIEDTTEILDAILGPEG